MSISPSGRERGTYAATQCVHVCVRSAYTCKVVCVCSARMLVSAWCTYMCLLAMHTCILRVNAHASRVYTHLFRAHARAASSAQLYNMHPCSAPLPSVSRVARTFPVYTSVRRKTVQKQQQHWSLSLALRPESPQQTNNTKIVFTLTLTHTHTHFTHTHTHLHQGITAAAPKPQGLGSNPAGPSATRAASWSFRSAKSPHKSCHVWRNKFNKEST